MPTHKNPNGQIVVNYKTRDHRSSNVVQFTFVLGDNSARVSISSNDRKIVECSLPKTVLQEVVYNLAIDGDVED